MTHVRVLHNANREAMLPFRGYQPGDPMICVYDDKHAEQTIARYAIDPEHASPVWLADTMFRLMNIDFEMGSPLEQRFIGPYRAAGNRSLSVGDVVQVDGITYACGTGWTYHAGPLNETSEPLPLRGTNPDWKPQGGAE